MPLKLVGNIAGSYRQRKVFCTGKVWQLRHIDDLFVDLLSYSCNTKTGKLVSDIIADFLHNACSGSRGT